MACRVHYERAKIETPSTDLRPYGSHVWSWTEENHMNRFGFVWMAAALAVAGVSGCSTKNYVRTQTQPLVEHTDKLDRTTSANNQAIHDVDSRAQAGVIRVQGAADTAAQNRSEERR